MREEAVLQEMLDADCGKLMDDVTDDHFNERYAALSRAIASVS